MSELKFLRYPSLTNHYAIEGDLNIMNEYRDKSIYYATEKVNGMNINITIDLVTGEYKFGKRSGFLKDSDKGDKAYLDSLNELITKKDIQDISRNLTDLSGARTVHIFGELFGSKIQKTNYDVAKDGKRNVILYDIFLELGPHDYLSLSLRHLINIIPVKYREKIVKMGTLSRLLSEEPDEKSQFGGVNEGYVYKPVEGQSYDSEVGHYAVVKHKTEKYLEVSKQPKKHVEKPFNHPELLDDLSRYITEID